MRKVAALLALCVLAAGCGGSGDAERDPEARGISAEQVSTRFEAEAGRPLEEAEVADEAWEQLGYGLDPSPSLLRRYGIFSVYVVEPGNDDALRSLLSDKATGEPLEPDERGIYWERDSQSRSWVAHSRYGPNVVLTWFSQRPRRATDPRWERLDAILDGLEGASPR